jgi:hypothetical protein
MQKSKRSTPKRIHRAGELRKDQTPAEAKLWAYQVIHRPGGEAAFGWPDDLSDEEILEKLLILNLERARMQSSKQE